MSDRPENVAFDERAPEDERVDALGQLQKSAQPSLSDLIPDESVRHVIDSINDSYQEQALRKSVSDNVVPFPSNYAKKHIPGMQSVRLDDWQLSLNGEYWDRPSMLGFDSLRAMVDQTPILNAVIMTRIRQVQRFCRLAEDNADNPGFEIKHKDKSHQIVGSEQESIKLLGRFMSNCGWEFSPRRRKALRRDSFSQLMAKAVRDSLTLDSVAIETEWKRDKKLGFDGLYAVDGGTIRLCTEHGYQGDDEIFALQVVQGRITSAYTFEDLIYEPRNPRSDVRTAGYGMPETELLVRVVTGFLNAMTYNIKGFDNNSIPKGMLHLSGSYTPSDIDAFKRYWNSMVRGVNNQWTLPVMVSKDQESKASFEKFGVDYDEMYFAKWMTFLTSIICAVYGMSPAEINFDSFTGGTTSALGGSDTAEKLSASKDSGLRPLLSYFENLTTDYIISEFSDDYVFRWTGLDPADASNKYEMRKLIITVDEARAEEGYDKWDGSLGSAPLNPVLMSAWQQEQQGGQDFGSLDEQADGSQEGSGSVGNDAESTIAAPLNESEDNPSDSQVAEPIEKALDFGEKVPVVYEVC